MRSPWLRQALFVKELREVTKVIERERSYDTTHPVYSATINNIMKTEVTPIAGENAPVLMW
jgi:hypothetical protein